MLFKWQVFQEQIPEQIWKFKKVLVTQLFGWLFKSLKVSKCQIWGQEGSETMSYRFCPFGGSGSDDLSCSIIKVIKTRRKRRYSFQRCTRPIVFFCWQGWNEMLLRRQKEPFVESASHLRKIQRNRQGSKVLLVSINLFLNFNRSRYKER